MHGVSSFVRKNASVETTPRIVWQPCGSAVFAGIRVETMRNLPILGVHSTSAVDSDWWTFDDPHPKKNIEVRLKVAYIRRWKLLVHLLGVP